MKQAFAIFLQGVYHIELIQLSICNNGRYEILIGGRDSGRTCAMAQFVPRGMCHGTVNILIQVKMVGSEG
ncbi:MAG: hypothetical protein BA862_09385 [Desulfobulbaceae bacterium S3730MH12]|nr:MAG: hypothetical protein BA866_01765 [Desulfobulbaceae bacterium S5133MH15]OEU55425.1 MAG: hypothetical protein BA862_09385 [Desulfobulbaceae bacterium S3730MH12]OEU81543.1 MAG: hypothetical protein BA873_14655 [Desulfobulbaceae bacterium C00003063]